MYHTEEGEGKPLKVNNNDRDDENISQFSGITGLDAPLGTPLSLSHAMYMYMRSHFCFYLYITSL